MKQRLIILSLHLKISNFQLKFSSITFSKVGDDIVSDVGGAQNCGIQVKFNVFLTKLACFKEREKIYTVHEKLVLMRKKIISDCKSKLSCYFF